MTPRQRDIYRYIYRYTDKHYGICPSHEEIAKGIGIRSIGTVNAHLFKMKTYGFIMVDPFKGKRNLICNPQYRQEAR